VAHGDLQDILDVRSRKAELENLTWDDVDLKAGIIRVASKPDWQPKTWEERTIEIPDELVKILTDLP
jgi:integrase